MKKMYLILLLFFGTLISAPIVVPPTCTLIEINEFEPIGDTGGSLIFTQKEIVFECNTTNTVQGQCLRWEDTNRTHGLTDNHDVVIKTHDFSDTIGSLFAKLGMLNKFNSLFGGWKGTCVYGTEINLDWMKDPYYLAGLALSFGTDAYAESFVKDVLGDGKYLPSFIGDMSIRSVGCLAATGLNLAAAYTDEGDPECDPVDEFCDEATTEEMILTMPDDEFVEFEKELAANNNWNKFIAIRELSRDSGIVTYMLEYKQLPLEVDATAAEEAMEQAKDAMQALRVLGAAITAIPCIMGIFDATDPKKKDEALSSPANIAKTALNFLPTDPFSKLLLKVAIDLLTSINNIDSCNDEQDAAEKGQRHLSTYEATKLFREKLEVDFDMCHFIREFEVDDNGFLGALPWVDPLYRKNYCCYGDMLSKTLMVQIKAQLGKSWTHCTDVSMKEFTEISFSACSDADRTSGPDGAALPWDATYTTRMTAYQAKQQCLDLDEFMEYFQALVGDQFEIDTTDINDALNDLRKEF
ncbi:MAG: Unknown protein [uncultured Campylobacterales bacterium]|uniref:Uncharacterized protein n=1 Tax=uncultured Campylobacterales bacterium TaxID=352960 RepID=A0A6S6TK63_9BACT|nr:MAG: Unknown protein [uncultured Campylobacterales bacterium]